MQQIKIEVSTPHVIDGHLFLDRETREYHVRGPAHAESFMKTTLYHYDPFLRHYDAEATGCTVYPNSKVEIPWSRVTPAHFKP